MLRPQLALALALDGRERRRSFRDFESQDIENPEPQVMLLSSGEVTPFTIELYRDRHRTAISSLTAELDGELEVSKEGYDST